jgi:hypothetical protein
MSNDSASPRTDLANRAPAHPNISGTTDVPNTASKSVLASRTFVGLALIALPIVAAKLGWRLLDPATQQTIDDILQTAGWILAAYGRLTAARPLHVTPPVNNGNRNTPSNSGNPRSAPGSNLPVLLALALATLLLLTACGAGVNHH